MNHDINDLYELIVKLSNKIDRLENVIKSNNCSIDMNIPEMKIEEWSCNCIVRPDDIETVYRDSGLDALKNCVLYNVNISPAPLLMNKNIMYVFDENGWSKWTDEHMRIFIRNIWQKFIYIHMNTPADPSLEDDLLDFHRKKILEMRKNVYDVKKNRMEFTRYLKSVCVK